MEWDQACFVISYAVIREGVSDEVTCEQYWDTREHGMEVIRQQRASGGSRVGWSRTSQALLRKLLGGSCVWMGGPLFFFFFKFPFLCVEGIKAEYGTRRSLPWNFLLCNLALLTKIRLEVRTGEVEIARWWWKRIMPKVSYSRSLLWFSMHNLELMRLSHVSWYFLESLNQIRQLLIVSKFSDFFVSKVLAEWKY